MYVPPLHFVKDTTGKHKASILFEKLSRATTWDNLNKVIREHISDGRDVEYLQKIEFQHQFFAAFSDEADKESRNRGTSNIVESFNSFILLARCLPPLAALLMIIENIRKNNKRIKDIFEKAQRASARVPPRMKECMLENITKSEIYNLDEITINADKLGSKVKSSTSDEMYITDLTQIKYMNHLTCSCRGQNRPGSTEGLCEHVQATLRKMKRSYIDFLDERDTMVGYEKQVHSLMKSNDIKIPNITELRELAGKKGSGVDEMIKCPPILSLPGRKKEHSRFKRFDERRKLANKKKALEK